MILELNIAKNCFFLSKQIYFIIFNIYSMKKIIIFTVVFITLATSIFVVSCKKEASVQEKKNVIKQGLVINESNYKEYLDILGVDFFFKHVTNTITSQNGFKVKYVLSAVNGYGKKQEVTFDSWDAACEHAKACNEKFPDWWTDWQIDGAKIDCPCFKINCYAK